ncbi:MAG: RNA polymerase subunit sigma-70 [Acidobacteria bacterium]|nr:MAG: RNA polymerase subunit sigma-70 [Acidobacteriota bacterium]
MTAEDSKDVSGLLVAWNNGDEVALDRLTSFLYPELRRIARRHLRGRAAGESLESAALANEAYLKLTRAGGIRCENRVHFLALCSQMIRRILDALLAAHARGVELLDLDEALSALSRNDARKGRVVELRYFGGLSVEETAEVLGISPETAKRDWRMAKAWLFNALTERRQG